MNKFCRLLLLFVAALSASCGVTKYVPEGQFLLNRVEIVSDHKAIKPATLLPYIKQNPNYKAFSIFPSQVSVYSWSGRDSTKWINRFLRKLGAPPVIYDEYLTEKTREDISKSIVNQGFMNVSVTTEVDKRKKKASVIYRVKTGEPYFIQKYNIEIGNETIAQLVNEDSANVLLKPGERFDRTLLDKERQRIVTLLRRKGYFGIGKEKLSYIADSALNKHRVDLTLQMFPSTSRELNNSSSPEQCQYLVKNVYIVTEYDPIAGGESTAALLDTVRYKGYQIIYGANKWIRPEVLVNSSYVMPNQMYDERTIDLTYSSFSRLKAVKYVNIRFEVSERKDSCLLNCYLMLSSSQTQSISTELEGTNSAGDLGMAASVTYQQRNIFHGSETFSAKVRGAYERLTGVGTNSNFTELGTELGLSFPKFMFPFIDYNLKRRVRAVSELIGTYNIQQRPEFSRVIAGVAWRYKWSSRNAAYRHSLDLIDVSYVYLPWIDKVFYDQFSVDNPLLRYSYENHFIMRTGYTFYLTNQNTVAAGKDPFSLRIGVETAGNTLNILSELTNKKKVDGYYQFLGINYSQYAKVEIDYARSRLLDESNTLAWHANLGLACPYGNSQILPFEKRYFAGGANSVRGWSVRTLGPGIFKQTGTSADFVNHSGDLKLDLSVELRSKLFWVVESALFIDAGNIWTIRQYTNQEGGLFRFDTFYKEIALAYGVGVRLNFNFFIFRLDLGFRAFDPSLDGQERWRFTRISSQDMAWHVAVGYPF